MSIRVAYGRKENISDAIETGDIPKGSMIITRDDGDSELLFYDTVGNLKVISEKNRFETITEAQKWVKDNMCVGAMVTVHNGSEWVPYIVQDDNTLAPFKVSDVNIDVTSIEIIDGGRAVDL